METIGDLLHSSENDADDLSAYSQFSNVDDLNSLAKDTPLNPCGILPKYVFTDSFSLFLKSTTENDTEDVRIAIDETNIASTYDREEKFKKSEDDSVI